MRMIWNISKRYSSRPTFFATPPPLMCHFDAPYFKLPNNVSMSGHVEESETPKNALIREFYVPGSNTLLANWQGGRTCWPKFRFSANFLIGFFFFKYRYKNSWMPNILCEKYFNQTSVIRWDSTLKPSWSNLKWVLFMNYRTLYATVA